MYRKSICTCTRVRIKRKKIIEATVDIAITTNRLIITFYQRIFNRNQSNLVQYPRVWKRKILRNFSLRKLKLHQFPFLTQKLHIQHSIPFPSHSQFMYPALPCKYCISTPSRTGLQYHGLIDLNTLPTDKHSLTQHPLNKNTHSVY